MKNLLTFLILVVLFSCTQKQEKQFITGNWKLVSYKIYRNGNAVVDASGKEEINQIKSWSSNTFVFAGETTTNKIKGQSFGNGTYKLDGNHYTENIEVHISPNYKGTKLNLLLEIKGDTLTQIFPVDKNWQYDSKNCWVEKYIRLK